MKILWIVNVLLDDINERLYNRKGGGVWMEALLEDFKKNQDVELVIATAYKVPERIRYEKDGITYYVLPDTYPLLYNENKKKNIRAWQQMLEEEKPDLIHIFGTEFTHGLCALRQVENIPVVLHMQGVLKSIARFYQTGMTDKEFRTKTLRDALKRDDMRAQRKRYYKRARKEEELIRLSKNVISENEWCDAYVKAACPEARIFHRAESMNRVFFDTPWRSGEIRQYAIACNASGYPIKGLHVLLKAVALVKKKYPTVKLYVPGTPVVQERSLKTSLRKNGYSKYIEKLIAKLGLQEQIVWFGNQTQTELARHNSRMHVFVMPSVIENHSNSLKEAMMQGIPCVASAVGGVTSYAKHQKNALLYHPEEFEVLAANIEKLFEDDEYARTLAAAGRESMLSMHQGAEIYRQTIEIYHQISNEQESEGVK